MVACGGSYVFSHDIFNFIHSKSGVGVWLLFTITWHHSVLLVLFGTDYGLFRWWILSMLRDCVLKRDSDHSVTFVFSFYSLGRLVIVKDNTMASWGHLYVCHTIASMLLQWTHSFTVLLLLWFLVVMSRWKTDVSLTRIVKAFACWLAYIICFTATCIISLSNKFYNLRCYLIKCKLYLFPVNYDRRASIAKSPRTLCVWILLWLNCLFRILTRAIKSYSCTWCVWLT